MRNVTALLLLAVFLWGCGKDDRPRVPPAVTLIFPENNSECITGITRTETTSEVDFLWGETSNAVRYELTVRHLASNVVENVITSGLSTSLVLEKGAAYSWSVVASNNSGQEGPEGATWQFFNAGADQTYPPFPAQLKEPGSGESVTADENGEFVLRWDGADVDSDLTEYEVYFGTDAAALPLYSTLGASENALAVPVVGGTVYYWEILSRDSEGNTSRSGLSSFRVL